MGLKDRDLAHVWHPFSQMQLADPIGIVRGEGSLLYDEQGNAIIDAISSWWVNIHGHSHPFIAGRIAEQAGKLEHVIFAGFTHEPAVQLAERLCDMLPGGLNRVFYSDNGSTAVEVGLKMAIQFWANKGEDRKRILALEDSYHGDTFGSMSVSARDALNRPFEPYMFDVDFIPSPACNSKEAVLESLDKSLCKGDTAALIVEPLLQGWGGMQMYAPEILDEMIALCRQYGVLVIADEVLTGFGRTGRCFAMDHCQQEADIVALSKGLTGGFMPMGVTACTDRIYEAFLSDNFADKTFFHGHSYTANPLACAAALASADLLETAECRERIAGIEHAHRKASEDWKELPHVRETRVLGTVLAMELDAWPGYFSGLREKVYAFALSEGVLLRPLGNVIYALPPYCIESKQLSRIHEVMAALPAMLESEFKQ